MGFFAGSGEYPAAGLYSLGHILILIFCFIVLILTILMTRKKSKNPIKVIKIVSIVVLFFEIIKVIWGTSVGRYSGWYDYLPLWFCSLFIPISIIAGFSKGKLQHTALTFMFYGGIVGGLVYLFCPTTSIGRYPVLHFITFHSMFYHVLMLYMGYFIIYQGLLKPSIKDFKWYFIITTSFCMISFIANEILFLTLFIFFIFSAILFTLSTIKTNLFILHNCTSSIISSKLTVFNVRDAIFSLISK